MFFLLFLQNGCSYKIKDKECKKRNTLEWIFLYILIRVRLALFRDIAQRICKWGEIQERIKS